MPTAQWTRVVIWLSAATWAVILVLNGESLKSNWAQPLGWAATVVVLLLLAFDRWIWCWPFVRSAVRHVDIRGTWKATLHTNYEARRGEEIETYVAIRQTYSTVSVTMLTDRATSASRSANLGCHNGTWLLSYLYTGEKHADAPDRGTNPHARGAAELVVATSPKVHLEGDYWTEVSTTGRISTIGHSLKVFDTFDAARSATYS
jgi:hypothetical protein